MNKNKKNNRTFIALFLFTICLFGFCTMAYSAINSTLIVSGDAIARVEADVRITDFRLASTNNATSSFEEFGKDHIITEIDLTDSSSSISYYVEITNYGSTDIGIFDITGLPSGVSYSIVDYNLKDKICDETGKCNSFIKQTYEITFTTTSTYSGNIQLNFDFRPFYNISYVGLTGSYINEFIGGDEVSIDFSGEENTLIYAIGEEKFDYDFDYSYVLTFSDVFCDVQIGLVQGEEFDYTGDVQTYKVMSDGIYKIELWGAQGGLEGGLGAYTSGYISLSQYDELHFYVGSQGVQSISGINTKIYCEFNCGTFTAGQPEQPNRYWGSGGGATDVRLVSGNWNDFDSLKSRIMVAAGGGGAFIDTGTKKLGGAGGGLTGYNGQPESSLTTSSWGSCGSGGTQTLGGYNIVNREADAIHTSQGWELGTYGYGSFGSGGNSKLGYYFAGGGAGYYGGGSSSHIQSAGGGSSFISWHDGCDAITNDSTSSNIVHIGKSNHYSGYVFSDTVMIDGNGYKWTDEKGENVAYMPTYDGSSSMTGNSGNGYAKITPIRLGETFVIKFTNFGSIGYRKYSGISHDSVGVSWTFDTSLYPNVKAYTPEGVEFSNYTYDISSGRLTIFRPLGNVEIRAEE